MSHAALSRSHCPLPGTPHAARLVVVLLVAWLVVVVALGAAGAFVTPPGAPPYPVALGVALPILGFLGLFRVSGAFRVWVLDADLPLITAVQGWRIGGFAFLALYAYGVLPGAFAWPAGLGDMAIGVTAPWMMTLLRRNPAFAAGKVFRVWNVFGILDLALAVGIGALGSFLSTGAPGEISTRPMGDWPLILIPAFFVPLFVMLHAAALFSSRGPTPDRD